MTCSPVELFYDDDPANQHNPLQEIHFDDGNVWSLADMKAVLMSNNAGIVVVE